MKAFLINHHVPITWQSNLWFVHRNVNLPVLPAGLQIMADQGFEHRLPVIVLPHANQPQLPPMMRRWLKELLKKFNVNIGMTQNYIYSLVIHRTFRSRRSMIGKVFWNIKKIPTQLWDVGDIDTENFLGLLCVI